MPRVLLVHWNASEAPDRLERLRALGHDPEHAPLDGPGVMRSLETARPAALVIDLSRLPSHGKEVGLHARMKKTTRSIPLVFVGGEPAKVAALRCGLTAKPFGRQSGSAEIRNTLRGAWSIG